MKSSTNAIDFVGRGIAYLVLNFTNSSNKVMEQV